jgi:hypothetical protein
MEFKTIQSLDAFVQRAEKLGKYRPGTAAGLRAALQALKAGLTTEEPDTEGYIQDRYEEILHRQVERAELAPNTLQTYLQRVGRVVQEFQLYGKNPKAMLAWTPKKVERTRRYSPASSSKQADPRLRTLAWSLRPDLVIQVQLPADFNAKDRNRLQKLLDLELEVSRDDANSGE